MPKTVTPIYFYPRSPCGERPFPGFLIGCVDNFYPRSPCGERHDSTRRTYHKDAFLSTLSLRRATASSTEATNHDQISIHALLAESDKLLYPSRPRKIYFYPRSPCGERHRFIASRQLPAPFLSTLSLRRATYPLR